MARTRAQSTTTRKSTSPRKARSSRSSSSKSKSTGFASTLEGWYASPVFSYVAGGIGFAAIAGAVYKFSDRYPRITHFFQENLDVIEGKLAEFRGLDRSSSQSSDEVTH